jgi:tRNA(Met) cytidine acetyltransferase
MKPARVCNRCDHRRKHFGFVPEQTRRGAPQSRRVILESVSASVVSHRLSRAGVANHRSLLVLAGARDTALECSARLLAPLDTNATLWITDRPGMPGPAQHRPTPDQLVGRELDALVLDVWAGFDADVFGAAAGTIRGGGVLLLCTPALSDWSRFRDPCADRFQVFPGGMEGVGHRYLSRLSSLLATDPRALVLPAETAWIPRGWWLGTATASGGLRLTESQTQAVAAVLHVVSGQRRRPVVLTADRGRGKSTALGYAAARLLEQGVKHIAVTAVNRRSVDVVFEAASATLTKPVGVRVPGSRLVLGDSVLEFVDPWRLLESSAVPDLVLVDEAAALPLHWHALALERFPRMTLASTMHGYEGSGRGFAVRLASLLDSRTRGWREIRLETPVRWAQGDPVEGIVFDSLLLDAEVDPLPSIEYEDISDSAMQVLDRDALLGDEDTLRQFFGILVHSHYRTRPNDLRFLLDTSNIELVVARIGRRVVAAAAIAREGGFDPAMAEQVWLGRSRPRGHMLAETLSAQLGAASWPCLRGLRIVRIAVHPEVRRRGVGSRLIQWILRSARRDGLDYLGTSFAIGLDVAAFWRRCGLMPVWLGQRRNASSGMRSIVMINPLSQPAQEQLGRARHRFLTGFAIRAASVYVDEDPAHVAFLFAGIPAEKSPTAQDLAEVRRFAAGHAGFEPCFPGIRAFTCACLHDSALIDRTSPAELALIIGAVLQQKLPTQLVTQAGSSGRGPVMDALRGTLQRWLADIEAAGA